MGENTLQAAIRRQLGLRVGPEMAAFIAQRISAGEAPLIGADARTGVAVHRRISSEELAALAEAAPSFKRAGAAVDSTS